MKVILVNPQAKRLRNNGDIGKIITEKYGNEAHVICYDGIKETGTELRRVAKERVVSEIYVVGGDGTFNKVLNWTLEQDKNRRPIIMSVGGGEMCYFARAQGLKSSDPLRNLERIFSGKIKLQRSIFRPLKLFNPQTNEVRYAGIIANGVVSDFVEWYEDLGKGSILKVVGMILLAILSVLFDSVRQRLGRLKYAEGDLTFEASPFPSRHVAFVASVISEPLPTCKVFRGTLSEHNFYTIAFSGTFRRLAPVLPLVWFGRSPKVGFHNKPITRLRYSSHDTRLVIDGDSVSFDQQTNGTMSNFMILKSCDVVVYTVCP